MQWMNEDGEETEKGDDEVEKKSEAKKAKLKATLLRTFGVKPRQEYVRNVGKFAESVRRKALDVYPVPGRFSRDNREPALSHDTTRNLSESG